ncbi:DNA polymerase III subunit gamma/tau [Pedomonas mirosovicensis]|uniref:DNA polymerase III subunit gamma/tau n=1 Tax=Pedomonas mirosovicensis TaxID=2908641 RepID=UPI0021680BF4|nr:DNA polymerase III subunit gamma/tau [Pedomonas mirosovicensis]MCH8685772.1 DNA polymerase III subunit gamma/tau [Pedomonas mirosovicensis]
MTDTPAPEAYRVLARKYRPSTFEALIGQDAMVRTLANAIETGRLAHAFLLTGVRGVGKTSTARLIAKALNCVGPDGTGGPTISPCGVCEPCRAISESRHIDVVEMDAASRTGIDDVREIIDAVRYAAVSARYKVYIIDEVHMLSKAAFNALLKTLEEPPAHVKFLFATTEIRKVPVTVLSRCQRFDLKRIPTETLAAHFQSIVEKEGATAEPEALTIIARAAEGSVRDGLSILDQAIAHGGGMVTAAAVRDMIGLADRALIADLMAHILEGAPKPALANLRRQYEAGADPATILQDLLELVHALTRLKLAPEEDADGLAEAERTRALQWVETLGFAALHRLWQLLLKGLQETQNAPSPIQAAEMAVLRLIHAASLPDPLDLLKKLENGESVAVGSGARAAAPSQPSPVARREEAAPAPSAPAPTAEVLHHPATKIAPPPNENAPADFEALVRLFESRRELLLGKALRDDAHLVAYAPGKVELRLTNRAPRDLAQRMMQCLESWTGTRWLVSLSQAEGQMTLREQEIARHEAERAEVLADPLVRAALETFPGAELVDFRSVESDPAGDDATDAPNSLRSAQR